MYSSADEIWKRIYDLLRGPARSQAMQPFNALTSRSDEDLLNSISKLKHAKSENDFIEAKKQCEAELLVFASTGAIAEKEALSLIDSIKDLEFPNE